MKKLRCNKKSFSCVLGGMFVFGLICAMFISPASVSANGVVSYAPPPTTLQTPSHGEVINGTLFPTFRWNYVSSASWYQVWIAKRGDDGKYVKYHAEWLKDRRWRADIPFSQGVYMWWVKTWNPDGSAWTIPGDGFTVDFHNMATPHTDHVEWRNSWNDDVLTPQFRWYGDQFSTWYRLAVRRDGVLVFDKWLEAVYGDYRDDPRPEYRAEGLNNTHHKVKLNFGTAASMRVPGDYVWAVQEWRMGDAVTSWSDLGTFNIGACTDPPTWSCGCVEVHTKFRPLSDGERPGTTPRDCARPRIEMDVNDALWYKLVFKKDGVAIRTKWTQSDWYEVKQDLPPGDYEVVVTPWNYCGFGDSDSETFLVDYAAPSGDMGLAYEVAQNNNRHPAFGYGYGYDQREAQIQVNIMPHVYWYRFQLTHNGTTLHDRWYDINEEDRSMDVDTWSEYGRAKLNLGRTLPAGTYKCTISVWNLEGILSSTINFVVDPLQAVTLLHPVTVPPPSSLSQPDFVWTEENEDVDQYKIWINSPNGLYYQDVIPAYTPVEYVETSASNSFAEVGVAQGWQGGTYNSKNLMLPFAFPFGNDKYVSCTVGMGGSINFDGSYRKISALRYTSNRPNTTTGDIYVETNATSVTIRWNGLYNSTVDAVNFSITLNVDGTIVLKYGDGNVRGGQILVRNDGYSRYSSKSSSGSMDNAADIIFTPETRDPSWRPQWSFPPRTYDWWIQPLRNDGKELGPWSSKGTFTVH